MAPTAYAMNDTVVEYEDYTHGGRVYELLELAVEEGDDCAGMHVETAAGSLDLRLNRADLDALIAAAQSALDNLDD
jgi:hypothetical protein